jgi:dTDP-4-dehydrorhamnose 3,5-epimerase
MGTFVVEKRMKFVEANLSGAWLIEPVPSQDSRGYFARTFCIREFEVHGLETRFVQHSTSYSARRGTIRGMHYQKDPHAEVKVVRCRKGAVWDVVIDLRPESPTHRQWQGFELTALNRRQLYIPAGFAHGLQTLCDDTETDYLISEFYEPAAASGVRFDDPAFAIDWPLGPTAVSGRDKAWPPFAS